MSEQNYAQLIESTSQMFAKALSHSTNLLEEVDTIEFSVKEALRQLGLQICSKLYNQAALLAKEAAKEPGLWVKRKTMVTFYTLFGPVSVLSHYLYNTNTGHSKSPTREALGIEGKARSLPLERALTDFGAESSFQRASDRFQEHYGWSINQSVVRQVTLDYARQAEGFVWDLLEEAKSDFEKPIAERAGASELLVELDGCEIRTCKLRGLPGRGKSPKRKLPKKKREIAWKEVRLGFCRGVNELDKKFVAMKGSYPEIGKQLFEVSVLKGLSSQTQVLSVSDGGQGLKECLDTQFDKMQFILDLPHFKGQLYETAEALGLDEEEREAWVKKYVTLAYKGKSKKLLEELESEHKRSENDRVRQVMGYVERFQDCIDYGSYKKKGWPIGSGEIESGHKHVVQQRLKITGASWKEENINPMLGLRVLRSNLWWEAFWEDVAQITENHRKECLHNII
jgi:hypothetical protein